VAHAVERQQADAHDAHETRPRTMRTAGDDQRLDDEQRCRVSSTVFSGIAATVIVPSRGSRWARTR
jgi:hypothetical protein